SLPGNPNPNDPPSMTAGHIAAVVSVVDGDGDPASSNAVDISGQITFLDDGPSVTAALNATATVLPDETGPTAAATLATGGIVKGDDPDVAGTNAISKATSGGAVVSLAATFGADGPGGAGSFALSITNGALG